MNAPRKLTRPPVPPEKKPTTTPPNSKADWPPARPKTKTDGDGDDEQFHSPEADWPPAPPKTKTDNNTTTKLQS